MKTIKSHWAYAEKILRIEAKNYRKKAICDYTERPWETIYPLIMEEKFPAIKIKGRWESLTYLIDEWLAKKIIIKRGGKWGGLRPQSALIVIGVNVSC